MQIVKIFGLIVLAGLLSIAALFIYKISPKIGMQQEPRMIATFEDCVAAGNLVMESYPRQCRTSEGGFFIENVPDIQVPPLPPENTHTSDCVPAGCSGQLCVSTEDAESTVTTCEYRNEYACYKNAICEKQASGSCGWTETAELKSCLAHPPTEDETMLPQAI